MSMQMMGNQRIGDGGGLWKSWMRRDFHFNSLYLVNNRELILFTFGLNYRGSKKNTQLL